jgi:hypothetical protein
MSDFNGAREEHPEFIRATRRQEIVDKLYAERGGPGKCSVVVCSRIEEFADLSIEWESSERKDSKTALDVSARRERIGALLQGDALGPAPEAALAGELALASDDEILDRIEATLARLRALHPRTTDSANPPARTTDSPADELALGTTNGAAPDLGHGPPPGAPSGSASAASAAEAAEPDCTYCGGRACVGPQHPAYSTLHGNDPEEVERRRKEQTAVMLATMRSGSGFTRW